MQLARRGGFKANEIEREKGLKANESQTSTGTALEVKEERKEIERKKWDLGLSRLAVIVPWPRVRVGTIESIMRWREAVSQPGMMLLTPHGRKGAAWVQTATAQCSPCCGKRTRSGGMNDGGGEYDDARW